MTEGVPVAAPDGATVALELGERLRLTEPVRVTERVWDREPVRLRVCVGLPVGVRVASPEAGTVGLEGGVWVTVARMVGRVRVTLTVRDTVAHLVTLRVWETETVLVALMVGRVRVTLTERVRVREPVRLTERVRVREPVRLPERVRVGLTVLET